MSKLDELIEELCPDGVVYKPINDFSKVLRGKRLTKSNLVEDGQYSVYHGGLEPLGKYNKYNREANSVMIINVGASAGSVGYSSEKFWSSDGCFCIEKVEEIDDRYLYHFMKNNEHYFMSQVRVAGIPTLNNSVVENFKVPVPPMEVQREIVHILDEFTLLSAELSAELSARKVQYEYYKNKLFDFSGENVTYMPVGELFDIRNGLSKEKSAFGHGKPIINFSDVYNDRWLDSTKIRGLVEVDNSEISRFSARKGDVFFTRTSETKDDIGMSSTLVDDIPDCVFSGFVLRARPKTDLLLPKFCAYFFSTDEVRKTIVRYAAVTTRATTTGSKLSKIMVPIIEKKRQQEIVDILDRFDCLCNGISEGIPSEILARKKQYEYYRDKLLTFYEAI